MGDDAARQAGTAQNETGKMLNGFESGNTVDGKQSAQERVNSGTSGAASRLAARGPSQASLLARVNDLTPAQGTEATVAAGAILTAGDDITINAATLTATGSEALCLEGLNSVRLYDCDLTGDMDDLEQNDNTWTVILYQSMSGGKDAQMASSQQKLEPEDAAAAGFLTLPVTATRTLISTATIIEITMAIP